MRGACIALTLRSAGVRWSVTAADGSRGAVGGAAVPGLSPLLQAPCDRARAFECMVYHRQLKQSGESPGDHLEGQFEGQNGAGERLCELAPASGS